MIKKIKKNGRYLAILVAVVLVLQTLVFMTGGIPKGEAKKVYGSAKEDGVTASEISNMTGVSSEELMKLRKEGKSWNEILETIKKDPKYKNQGNNELRDESLVKAGLGEDTLKKLKEEGYKDEEINAAKTLAERVIFQLEEITWNSGAGPVLPETNTQLDDKKKDDTEVYKNLSEKINLEEAVSLMLRLKAAFGSYEAVLDEYLCSLQLDIKLSDYIADKDKYEEAKRQKLVELNASDIVNLSKIEERMLAAIQQSSTEDKDSSIEANSSDTAMPQAGIQSPLPEVDVPAPDAQSIKPQDPADELLTEINGIKNSNTLVDGR